jgi:hypothetical protein
MTKKIFTLLLLVSPFLAIAQQPDKMAHYVATLNANDSVAIWLCRYDEVAWVSSDSVSASPKEQMAKLGKQWFCFRENKTWHAVYGKYENGVFNTVFHYIVDTARKIKRIYTAVDSFLAGSLSRALINADEKMKKYLDTNYVLRFNQYVRKNPDNTIAVWLFPAFQTNGTAVYGAEFYYKYDAKGNNLLDKYEYFQGKFRGFKTGQKRDIYINYTDLEEPSLGAVFFARYYKPYFTNITIEVKHMDSQLFNDNGNYTWISAIKEEREKDK